MPNHFYSGAESGENKEKLMLNQDLVVCEHYIISRSRHSPTLILFQVNMMSKKEMGLMCPCLCHRGPWLNGLSAEVWEEQSETSGRLSQLHILRVSVIVAY